MAGRHQAVLSVRNDLVNNTIDHVYAGLEVCPDFNEKHDVYQMWTFEDQGDDLHLPEDLAKDLRLVRWHDNSSDVVLKNTSKALGVSKIVEHLGLKPENILVLGMNLTTLSYLIMQESVLQWEFHTRYYKKKLILSQKSRRKWHTICLGGIRID